MMVHEGERDKGKVVHSDASDTLGAEGDELRGYMKRIHGLTTCCS